MMKLIFSIAIVLLFCGTAFAEIIHVPGDQPTIQAGIDSASIGDTVLVDTGRYVENINFNGKNIVVGSLFLINQDTSYISQTVIDGNQNGSVVTFENGEDSTALLTGFTIINGLGDGWLDYIGGGITCKNNSNPSLINVIIRWNSASHGGGILCYNSSPILSKVTIIWNSAAIWLGYGNGGGIYCSNSSPNLTNVTISGNTANGDGGGINCEESSSPTLTNVTIGGNGATRGGGIYCYNSSPNLVNVTVSGNMADWSGGGISCGYSSSPNLVNVTVSRNTATFYGGGISFSSNSSPSLENVTVSWNMADIGGGIYCYSSSPRLENVTMGGNTAFLDGGGIYCYSSSPSLVNTILWNDTPQEIYFSSVADSNSITIAYSDVQGGEAGIVTNDNATVNWLDGNIDADPLFVGGDPFDYHLTENSSCINAGTAFFIWNEDTLINLPDTAYYGNAPDMGAYESEFEGIVDISSEIPKTFTLSQNYPNPFNPTTTFRFGLPRPAYVILKVYNLLGQEVVTLVDESKLAGYHKARWDVPQSGIGSGIYFYRIEARPSGHTVEFVKVRKCLLVK